MITSAPASLLGNFILTKSGPFQVYNEKGTLWRGTANLNWAEQDMGELQWNLDSSGLLSGKLLYEIVMQNQSSLLSINSTTDLKLNNHLTLNGNIEATVINQVLEKYNIRISGGLTIEDTQMKIKKDTPLTLAGNIKWSGGPISYALSGLSLTNRLPPLQIELGPGKEAIVYEINQRIPLIKAEILDTGFAKIGLTKHLIGLLGVPWPRNSKPGQIVIEVEEKLSNISKL